MPTYKVTDPTSGKVVRITGEKPPTEAELGAIFKQVNTSSTAIQPQNTKQSPSLLEGITSFLFPQGFSTGSAAAGGFALRGINKESDARIKELGQQSRDLIERARNEQDPSKKAFLLQQSRNLDAQIESLGSNVRNAADTVMDKGRISELDLQRSNLDFAARRGAAVAGETAAYLLPEVKAFKGVNALSKIGNAGLTGAVIGGVTGVTDPQAEDGVDRAAKGFSSAALGGALGAGTAGVTEAVKGTYNLLRDAAARQLINQNPSQVIVNEYGRNKLAQGVIDKFENGEIHPGRYNSVKNQATNKLDTIEKQLQEVVSKSDEPVVNIEKSLQKVQALADDAAKAGNSSKAEAYRAFYKEIKAEWPSDLSTSQALELKRKLDGQLAESMFSKAGDESVAARSGAQLALSNNIRNTIKQTGNNPQEVERLLNDESTYIQLRKAMEYQLKRSGGAPLKGESVGGFNILNLIGKIATFVPRDPAVESAFLQTGRASSLSPVTDRVGRGVQVGTIENISQSSN